MPAAPVVGVVIDMCPCRQPMHWGRTRKRGYMYVAVEVDVVAKAIRGMQRANVVLGLRQVAAAELLEVVAWPYGWRVYR